MDAISILYRNTCYDEAPSYAGEQGHLTTITLYQQALAMSAILDVNRLFYDIRVTGEERK